MAIRCNLLVLMAVALWLVTLPVAAHPASATKMTIHQSAGTLKIELLLPLDQLQQANPLWPALTAESPSQLHNRMASYLDQHLIVTAADTMHEEAYTIQTDAPRFQQCDYETCLFVSVTAATEHARQSSSLVVQYDGITHRVRNHRTLVSVSNSDGDDPASHATVLSWRHTSVSLKAATLSITDLLIRYFNACLHHIFAGTDHLLFLFCLLFTVVSASKQHNWRKGYTWRQALIMISLFTAGHTVSLALSATGVISMPVWLTEACVAATVLVTAVLLLIQPARLHKVPVLLFGVIHGVAFSEVMQGLPLDTVTRLLAVAGFNAGVEVFQAALSVVVLPLLLMASRYTAFAITRAIFAFLTACFGFNWLTERIMTEPGYAWLISAVVLIAAVITAFKLPPSQAGIQHHQA